MDNRPALFPRDRTRLRIAAWLWVATVEFYVTQLIAGAVAPGYSLRAFDISDLGRVKCAIIPWLDLASGPGVSSPFCSPWHGVFNVGMVLLGLLSAAGALLAGPLFPVPDEPGWHVGRIGRRLFAAASLGVSVAGLYPVDVNPTVHGLGAGTDFIFGKIGLMMMAFALLRRHRVAGAIGLATVTVSAFGFMLFIGGAHPLGRGVEERIAGWLDTFWLIGLGIGILRGRLGAGRR